MKKDAVKVVIHYEDGTTKEVDKCMVVTLKPLNDEEVTLQLECCNITGKDYQNTMFGLLSLAAKTIQMNDDEPGEE